MRRSARALTTALVTSAVVALAGCAATPGGVVDAPSPSATSAGATPTMLQPLVPLTDPEVLDYCPAVDAVEYDDTLTVTDAFVCVAGDILSTGDGPSDEEASGDDPASGDAPSSDDSGSGTPVAEVQRASRVVGGLDELLAAYREPNAATTAEACIQIAADPLIVWLESDEAITPVYAPVDECGFPQTAAADAYAALELDELVESRLGVHPTNPND